MSKLESLVVEEPNALNSGGTKSVLCTLRATTVSFYKYFEGR